ncbi:MAG: ATP-dependent RNA helicase HrpA [bacterium]
MRPSLTYPADLPIVRKRSDIIYALRRHPVVVITGDTGSGKTTQIPKMCLEAGRGRKGRIGCTQPRRVAAVSVALRVAEELGEEGGAMVGYQIRFQDRTSPTTRIKFMTDGILLAESQRDPMFRSYDTLIIDEAHERSLNIDFLLGILRQLLPRRRDLKVVITSATIDTEKFSRSFNNAPIIEVSGRTYPVEVWYRPVDHNLEDAGEITYIDQAVKAIDELEKKRCRGDILIFMPSERDIRETRQRLEGRKFSQTIILPLFGRLSSDDQHRIFSPTLDRKIIIATNIAETSITVPGIRYVIDTGLARMAQYNARTHTQSLPIQYVSQSSADQRKGRCGRVEAGICLRLYSEEEYLSWPQFTLPEIKRSNLAEVILQMIFLKLGNVASFPFIDPPSPSAIKDGYAELRELGALDKRNQLTSIGGLMARLPLDPRISRMLIQAKREGAVREIAIIASALSVPDPRERPAEQESKADQIHARFFAPSSDFLTFLKIWEACQVTLEKFKTQNQMRKFCKAHFLSYNRMREWQDIHEQILSILDEMGEYPQDQKPASYEAIHRSILSGFLSHIGQRDERNTGGKNIYLAARGRQVMIFPGSGQFGRAGQWIVAAEIVRTSRLFARVVATIQPEWLEDLAGSLCKSSYSDPHWEMSRGQVVAFERVTLYGLPIIPRRKVHYGPVQPDASKEIFIRSALVEGEIKEKFTFLDYNQRLISKLKEWEEKTRRRDLLVDDEALFQFYHERISEPISDLRTFIQWLKDKGGDDFLKMRPEDLLRAVPDQETTELFPDTLQIGDFSLPLTYTFEPGREDDGVTLHIPVSILPHIPPEPLEWLVPGLLLDKMTTLLKGLPKAYRKQIIPLQQSVLRLREAVTPYQGSLYEALEEAIRKLYGIHIPRNLWSEIELPPYLLMRFVVSDPMGRTVGQGRDLTALARSVPEQVEDYQWKEACRKWQRDNITNWDFEGLPEKIMLSSKDQGLSADIDSGKSRPGPEQGREIKGKSSDRGEIHLVAYPGLVAPEGPLLQGHGVSLRLFRSRQEAVEATRKGLLLLYTLQFKDELNQLKGTWDLPPSWKRLYQFSSDRKNFNEILFARILQGVFPVHEGRIPGRKEFLEQVEQTRGTLASRGWQMVKEFQNLLEERQHTLDFINRFRHMVKDNSFLTQLFQSLKTEVTELLPPDFLSHHETNRLREIPRYLKAVRIRLERAYASPMKDQTKAQQLSLYQAMLRKVSQELDHGHSWQKAGKVLEFRWMIEEFKVSLFAQELGTAYPVSAKRLDKKWEEIQNL